MRRPRAGRWEPERGAIAVATVFFVILLLVFLAGVINIGHILATRGVVQHAADSAALAAAHELDGQPDAPTRGRTAAQQFGGTFTVAANTHVSVAGANVDFGFWHWNAGACVFGAGGCAAGFEPDPGTSFPFADNTVRVRTGWVVPSTLEGFWQNGNIPVYANAWAIGRRARVSCALPVAIPSCRILDANGALNCDTGVNVDGDPYRGLFFNSGHMNVIDPLVPCTSPAPVCPETANDDANALGRIDVLDVHAQPPPIGDPDSNWTDFTRYHTFWNDTECEATPREYLTGTTPMAVGQPDYRVMLEALVQGLVGIKDGSHTKTGPCMLGQKHVVPVVREDSCDAAHWPATGSGEVIGYVTVVFRYLICSDTRVVDTANCDDPANVSLVNACANDQVPNSGHLRAYAEVLCENPTGPGPGTAADRSARALRTRLAH